ncbi:MAG: transposase, IS3 family [Methyloprofundus sp.]|nr:MAG: transposase, IS3 family [Methyloprofundus sp.]BCG62955.1 MAG: transposase, IS3 family [Methyloprofundus sp.]BCG62976.1 MAG: transposase, IS3 family [Methyloprofundus sp.]BCG63465.1 MAG: transposase, IS3 family [Methyloprofundus sp.]BCG63534.1 MAG: transposase, IS3 family [Methyloprofundus sp.]
MGTQHYSKQFKEAIIKKLNQSELSLRQFAKQESMNPSTLYKWKEEFKISGLSVSKEIPPEQWSAEEKFAVVLEIATLSEIEVSEYCRSKGLYPEQINTWKQACIAGNVRQAGNKKALQAATKSDKKRIKELEKELNRKEKALAETAALLVLRKKFNAYWGEDEDN